MDGPLGPLTSFRRRLDQLGYVEGRNIQVVEQWVEGRSDRLAELAAELTRESPDVIVTYGSRATSAAMDATKTVPIVAAAIGDGFATRAFASLARPGGNVTGFVSLSTALWSKRLSLAKELLPSISKVAYLSTSETPLLTDSLRSLTEAAKGVEIAVSRIELPTLGPVLGQALRERGVDLVMVSTGDSLGHRPAEITRFMGEIGLPAFYGSREFVNAGGLISYGPDYDELFRHTADYTDRILRGAKPGELPAQQAERFEFVINLRTARALGLMIPPTLLARADEVIE